MSFAECFALRSALKFLLMISEMFSELEIKIILMIPFLLVSALIGRKLGDKWCQWDLVIDIMGTDKSVLRAGEGSRSPKSPIVQGVVPR